MKSRHSQLDQSANPSELKQEARSVISLLRNVAIVWCAMTLPIPFVVLLRWQGSIALLAFVSLFPAVGIAMLWYAMSRIARAKRHGEVIAKLSPEQPRVGDTITFHVSFNRQAPQGMFTVSLVCERVSLDDEGSSSSVLWRQDHGVAVGGSMLSCVFQPPPHLPASEIPRGSHHKWTAVLKFPDGKDERRFDLIVKAVDRTRHPNPAIDALPIPAKLASIVDGMSALRIDYNPVNVRKLAVVAAVVASVVSVIAAFLMTRGSMAAFAMGLVFGASGVGLYACSLYLLTHHRRVEIANGNVRVDVRSLFGTRSHEFAATAITSLEPTITMSTGNGTQTHPHYEIRAYLSDGRRVALASNVREPGVVATLLQAMQRHLDLPNGKIVSVSDADEPHTMSARHMRDWVNTSFAKRIILSVKIVTVLITLAFVWDFVSPLLPKSERSQPSAELQVER